MWIKFENLIQKFCPQVLQRVKGQVGEALCTCLPQTEGAWRHRHPRRPLWAHLVQGSSSSLNWPFRFWPLCLIFKIDPKHYRESEVQYLSLPYMKTPTWAGMSKPSCQGFSCSSKDYFYAKTNLCSTNFTQNGDKIIHLYFYLSWISEFLNMIFDF